MATASSVQREPSMEEILASIRRIIEDSDTGRKQPGEADDLLQDLASVPLSASAAGMAPSEARGAQPAVGKTQPEVAEAAPEVDAFRAELRPGLDARRPATRAEIQAAPVIARVEPPVRSDPAPVKAPVTLAQMSARVTAEPAPATRPDAPAAATVAETAVVADWRREIAAVGETAAKTDKAAAPDKSELRRTPDAGPKVEVFEDAAAAEPAFEDIQPQSVSAPPAAVEALTSRPAILSEHTGRQVAAAFGELSDAFANRSKKTFDEMAEEMLRPMLQDWLDNNLPTLVERLVREEIERVARGAQ
ncbi:conserved hypothetical protein [Mesorhizobium metallidurans STM 2683]|uniref:DUF2497 domain-containing protein n=1 Tax=Mesorhizobium metallidurans STM 2683 TaxID=1297569 RepID=M5EU52_9HYPH|nr:DUF2497 domain-containing protein [Mesorhizobium metallidurans]CCV07428.1 conserved hypothetical protein [Mesorhizobium metallidurans STM 2683]